MMMRRFKNIIIIALGTLLLTACAGKLTFGKIHGKEYLLEVNKDKSVFLEGLSLKDELHIVSKTYLDMNVSTFVLTGAGVNNLEGFPINTYKDLNKYVELHNSDNKFTTNGYNGGIGKTTALRDNFGGFRLIAMPADKYKNSFISVWDAKKTFDETK